MTHFSGEQESSKHSYKKKPQEYLNFAYLENNSYILAQIRKKQTVYLKKK